jgi:hypothetical protein
MNTREMIKCNICSAESRMKDWTPKKIQIGVIACYCPKCQNGYFVVMAEQSTENEEKSNAGD